mgnify:CR=1 FL=1
MKKLFASIAMMGILAFGLTQTVIAQDEVAPATEEVAADSAAVDSAAGEKARRIVEGIAKDPEVGDMFISEVVRILPKVGAFCELAPGKDGLIHISKMSEKRINSVEEVLHIGDKVKVEIIKIGEKGIDLKLLEIVND